MSERKNSSWIVWGSIAMLVVLMLYPLSVGPYAWISIRCQVTNNSRAQAWVTRIGNIYYPLSSLIHSLPPEFETVAEDCLETYVKRWAARALR